MTEHKQEPTGGIPRDKPGFWWVVARLNEDYALYKIPIYHLLVGTKGSFGEMIGTATRRFNEALRECEADLETVAPQRQHIDMRLASIIQILRRDQPDGFFTIIDFTRTSLPQLDSKKERDALAFGHYMATWRERGYGDGVFVTGAYIYSEREWSSQEAESYYKLLRKEHPLVLYWRNSDGERFIHDSLDVNS